MTESQGIVDASKQSSHEVPEAPRNPCIYANEGNCSTSGGVQYDPDDYHSHCAKHFQEKVLTRSKQGPTTINSPQHATNRNLRK